MGGKGGEFIRYNLDIYDTFRARCRRRIVNFKALKEASCAKKKKREMVIKRGHLAAIIHARVMTRNDDDSGK